MENQEFEFGMNKIYLDGKKSQKHANQDSQYSSSLSQFVKQRLFRKWTEDDLNRLMEMYSNQSNYDIAKILNKTKSSIDSKAFYLGLKKDGAYRRTVGRLNNLSKKQAWSDEDIQFLKKNYQNQKYSDVGNNIKRTSNAVSQKVRQLHLRKYARNEYYDQGDVKYT